MVVHFIPGISVREFGTHLFSVEKFQKWLDLQGLEVPIDPPLSPWKFIQVEALLCAIERGATAGMTDSDAGPIVKHMPRLSAHEDATIAPKWLLGAEAHWNWREKIRQAVNTGELQLLDFASKLPVSVEQEPAAPEPPKPPDELAPPAPTKPLQRQAAQENEILSAIREAGHDPLSLPERPAGKSGIKSEIRAQLVGQSKNFPKNGSQFDKAWVRLRADGRIVD